MILKFQNGFKVLLEYTRLSPAIFDDDLMTGTQEVGWVGRIGIDMGQAPVIKLQ